MGWLDKLLGREKKEEGMTGGSSTMGEPSSMPEETPPMESGEEERREEGM